jgi:hypothetical protein
VLKTVGPVDKGFIATFREASPKDDTTKIKWKGGARSLTEGRKGREWSKMVNESHHSICFSTKDRIEDRICSLTASGTSLKQRFQSAVLVDFWVAR